MQWFMARFIMKWKPMSNKHKEEKCISPNFGNKFVFPFPFSKKKNQEELKISTRRRKKTKRSFFWVSFRADFCNLINLNLKMNNHRKMLLACLLSSSTFTFLINLPSDLVTLFLWLGLDLWSGVGLEWMNETDYPIHHREKEESDLGSWVL